MSQLEAVLLDVALHFLLISLACMLAGRQLDRLLCSWAQDDRMGRRQAPVVAFAARVLVVAAVVAGLAGAGTLVAVGWQRLAWLPDLLLAPTRPWRAG